MEDRLRRWTEMTDAFVDSEVHAARPEDVTWRVEGVMLGPLVFGHTEIHGVTQVTRRTVERIAGDGMDLLRVFQVLSGPNWRRTDVGEFGVRPGEILVTDLARPEWAVTENQIARVLMVPRAMLGVAEAELDHLHGLVLRRETLGHALLSAHFEALWGQRQTMRADEVERACAATVGLLANLMLRRPPSRWAPGQREEVAILKVMRFIRENLGDPGLTPELLARRFGMSRASLYRAFEPLGGVVNHVRNQRLRAAAAALAAGEGPVGQVSARVGFANASAFQRAYRRKYGHSPAEARAVSRAGQAGIDLALAEQPHMVIPAWVRVIGR